MSVILNDDLINHLEGGCFAMDRCKRYWGHVVWEQHSVYKNHMILRAYHIDTGKPCALYACIHANVIMSVSENLSGIKAEISRWAE